MILDDAPRVEMIRALGGLTVADVLDAKFPSIASLRRPEAFGRKKVEEVTASIIIDASGYFEQSISAETAIEMAAEIGATYYYLSLEDIYVCLQQFKRATLFGRNTPNKILNAVEEYNAQRLKLSEERSLNAHLARKESRQNYDRDNKATAIRDHEAFTQFKEKYEQNRQSKNPML